MPIVPGTNPALQTWNGQFFVVADGSSQNRISLPFLQVNSGGATYVIGADNNGTLSYYNPLYGGSANNLIGGTAGSLPYQTTTDITTFLPIGTAGQVLKVSNSGFPQWTTPLAPTAQNISGGTAGVVVYQTAPNTTGFTAQGVVDQVLTSAGTNSPTWTNQSALSVGSATNATNATNATTATTAGTATNIANGLAGSIPFQTGASTTTTLGIGSANQLLTVNSGGTAPQWKTGITGVTDGSSAASGYVGEWIVANRASGSAITLTTTGTVYNVASINLTAGDWNVSASVNIHLGSTTMTTGRGGISTANNALTVPSTATTGVATNSYDTFASLISTSNATSITTTLGLTGDLLLATKTSRVNLSGSVTLYLVATAAFTGTAPTAYGTIEARRMR
jgi:hypothetical protein